MDDLLRADDSRPVVLYVKTALTSLTSMILAMFVPTFWTSFRNISQEKATGLGAVAGRMFENLFSGWFLILFLSFLALFFVTGRLGDKTLRILFFWVPTIAVCGFAAIMWGALAYAMRHIPQQ
jgi:hypothetical protein